MNYFPDIKLPKVERYLILCLLPCPPWADSCLFFWLSVYVRFVMRRTLFRSYNDVIDLPFIEMHHENIPI